LQKADDIDRSLQLTTYRTGNALDPLRRREDFELMTMDLAVPAQPFAAAR
jgi:hypothetical protein